MADDQVTIDPEFNPRSEREGRPRPGWGWIAVAAAVAAFAFGWLLGSPASTEQEQTEQAASTSTAPTVETTSTTSPTSPTSTMTTATSPAPQPRELASLDAPLSEIVPGFTDTIVMLTTPESGFNVMQWNSSELMTEEVLSLDRDELGWSGGWPIGLDASGNWFAQRLSDGVLTVHAIPEFAEEWSEREAVGLYVESVVWHDTEPGQLAWLTCPRDESGGASLFALDMADRSAGPVLVRTFEEGCRREMWLERWVNEGMLVLMIEGNDARRFLVDVDGTEISIEPQFLMPVDGPGGTTLWIEQNLEQSGGASFVLSVDGSHRSPVPGLADDELLSDASWSPDGTHLALIIWQYSDGGRSLLRVVDATTGAEATEAEGFDSDQIPMAWSSDGRFLLYESGSLTLEFYDTVTDTTTVIPLSEIVDEIRVRDPDEIPFFEYSELESDVDRSTIDGADIAPTSEEGGPYSDGDGSLDTTAIRLPPGERTAPPGNPRLDFLNTVCEHTHCFRDAVVIDPGDSSEGNGEWRAGVPFHVRHGFVNDTAEPLDERFDVVVSVTRRQGPELESGLYEIDHTYLFSTDYVLQGMAAECGPGYWDQTESQTCEWFVHDFPEGLPEGRYDLWAMWFAPCSAWQDLGLTETCDDPTLVTSLFAGSVNMPFNGPGFQG